VGVFAAVGRPSYRTLGFDDDIAIVQLQLFIKDCLWTVHRDTRCGLLTLSHEEGSRFIGQFAVKCYG